MLSDTEGAVLSDMKQHMAQVMGCALRLTGCCALRHETAHGTGEGLCSLTQRLHKALLLKTQGVTVCAIASIGECSAAAHPFTALLAFTQFCAPRITHSRQSRPRSTCACAVASISCKPSHHLV